MSDRIRFGGSFVHLLQQVAIVRSIVAPNIDGADLRVFEMAAVDAAAVGEKLVREHPNTAQDAVNIILVNSHYRQIVRNNIAGEPADVFDGYAFNVAANTRRDEQYNRSRKSVVRKIEDWTGYQSDAESRCRKVLVIIGTAILVTDGNLPVPQAVDGDQGLYEVMLAISNSVPGQVADEVRALVAV